MRFITMIETHYRAYRPFRVFAIMLLLVLPPAPPCRFNPCCSPSLCVCVCCPLSPAGDRKRKILEFAFKSEDLARMKLCFKLWRGHCVNEAIFRRRLEVRATNRQCA